MKPNPRYKNGHRRRQLRAWILKTQNTCHLCGQPVNKKLKTPHPLSPEIDELIPISKGGNPLDPNNVALAHRICNQKRGNKPLTPTPKQANPPQPTIKWG